MQKYVLYGKLYYHVSLDYFYKLEFTFKCAGCDAKIFPGKTVKVYR